MKQEFAVHVLNETGKAKARGIAEAYDQLLVVLLSNCPHSRELSIARTKLEESCFFAKKAMASDPANGEVVP